MASPRQWIDEYAAFRIEHGRDPRQQQPCAEEVALANWLARTRVMERARQLDAETARQMDRINPHWRSPDGRPRLQFGDRLTQYDSFRAEHRRDPQQSARDPNERALARWLKHQRTMDRRGLLRDEQSTALEEVNPHWRGIAGPHRPFAHRLAEYRAFVAQHGRDPRGGATCVDERTLARWVAKQRRRIRSSELDADVLARPGEPG